MCTKPVLPCHSLQNGDKALRGAPKAWQPCEGSGLFLSCSEHPASDPDSMVTSTPRCLLQQRCSPSSKPVFAFSDRLAQNTA